MSFRLISISTAVAAALVTVTASAQQPAPDPAAQPQSAPDPAAQPAPDSAAQPAPGPAAQPAPGPAAQPQPVAQPQPAPEKKDGVRFRGGIAAEGGGLLVPDITNFGMAGVQGQLGVQINNNLGAYVVPSFAIVFGDLYGIHLGAAALFEYTFLDSLMSVGAGPDVASFVAFGVPGGIGITASAGSLYGGRLHFAIHPAVGIGANGIRRKAFTIGVDLRLYGGGAGLASSGTGGAVAKVADFIASPTLSLGYTAF